MHTHRNFSLVLTNETAFQFTSLMEMENEQHGKDTGQTVRICAFVNLIWYNRDLLMTKLVII